MIVSGNSKCNDGVDGVSATFISNPPKNKLMKRYFNYLRSVKKPICMEDIRTAKRQWSFTRLLRKMFQDHWWRREFPLQKIWCISLYSKKAAEKLGLKSVMDVDLLHCKDDGQPILQDTPPHNVVFVMVLQLAWDSPDTFLSFYKKM